MVMRNAVAADFGNDHRDTCLVPSEQKEQNNKAELFRVPRSVMTLDGNCRGTR